MRTRRVTFADLKPGHKFCISATGFAEFPHGVYMRVRGTVVSCVPNTDTTKKIIPGDEYGEYCNAISLTNGEILFINEMQNVWV